MLKAIKEYFRKSDMIKDDETIFADYLPAEAVKYAIYQTGDADGGVIKEFIGGDQLRSFSFIFASRFNYSNMNTLTNIQNSAFYAMIQEWIEENNKNNILPDVDNAQKLEVLQTGSLFMIDPNQMMAEYQMMCRLIYYKEKRR